MAGMLVLTCCMAGMLDTFSSNITCGNILQCVLYLLIAASTKPENLVLFSTVYLFPPSLLAVFVSLVSSSFSV